MDRAIVRQATKTETNVINVGIPNSLLQEPFTIRAHIGIYEGDTFKVVEVVEIPVVARTRPADYQIQDADEEVYSFKALKNDIANMVKVADFNKITATINSRLNNIITHNNDTEGNTELVDIRVDGDGNIYDSAGTAIRTQLKNIRNDLSNLICEGQATLNTVAKWVNGGVTSGVVNLYVANRIATSNTLVFDRDIILNIKNGFKMGIHILDENGTFISDSGWKTTAFYIPKNSHFKIVIAKVTEVSDKADIFEFSSALTIQDSNSSQLREVTDILNNIDNDFTFEQFPGTDPNNQVLYIDVRQGTFELIPSYYATVNLGYMDGTEQHISDGILPGTVLKFTIDKPIHYIRCYAQSQPFTIHLREINRITKIEDAISKLLYPPKKTWLTSAHRGFVDVSLKENTLGAFYNAYINGADMIEVDARLTKDGILVCNHDETVTGIDPDTNVTVTYSIADTSSDVICSLILSNDEKWGKQTVPTLDSVLNLAYNTGLIVNIDMKNGYNTAEVITKTVLKSGMRGRVIYALNGSGVASMHKILEFDSSAKFIDSLTNFTGVNLSDIEDYRNKCYIYTSDFSEANINAIRETGCMLALISLNSDNFITAIKYNPEMCEYLHTSDFKSIEQDYFKDTNFY